MKSPSNHQTSRQTSRHDGRATPAQSSFPRTDYYYQSAPRASAASLSASRHSLEAYGREVRSFREISQPVIGSRFNWQFAVESTVLGLVGAIAAWPIVSLLILLAQTALG